MTINGFYYVLTLFQVLANLFSDPVTATQSLCDKMSGVAENVSTSVDHVVKVHTQIEFAFQC